MAIIACKECDHKISDQAASCPSCGAPVGAATEVLNRSQRILIGSLLAFAALSLLGVSVWINAARTSTRSSAASTASSPMMEPRGPAPATVVAGAEVRADAPLAPRTVYQTTAERLYEDYLANGVATQSKIAKSLVRITGKVAAIDEDAAGNPVVRLAASGDAGINMTLGSGEVAAAAQLVRGQTVDIQCDKMRRVLGSPEGSGCSLALVQGGPTPLAAREPPPAAAPAIDTHRVGEAHAVQSRRPRQTAPAPLIAMVPSTEPETLPHTDVTPQANQSAASVTTPLAAPEKFPVSPIVPIATAAVASPMDANTPAPVTVAAPPRLTPAADVSTSVQDAPVQDAPSQQAAPVTAATTNDDLATVRAADPQAADHIASYCAANASATGSAGAATCRRDEREAYTRLVLHNEFPALDDATRRKCSQPPFPDSYRAKEICAKYELRIY
jgi:hypothetical protein